MGVAEQSVNGIKVGEFGDLAMVASELGTRSIFATGCEAFCKGGTGSCSGHQRRSPLKVPDDPKPPAEEVYREHNKSAPCIFTPWKQEEGSRRCKRIWKGREKDFGLIDLPKTPWGG